MAYNILLLVLINIGCTLQHSQTKVPTLFLHQDDSNVTSYTEEQLTTPSIELLDSEQRKSFAGYHFLVAEYLNLKGDFILARDLYESSYELDPDSYLAEKYLAAEIKVGANKDILSKVKKMSLLYPKSTSINFLLTKAYIQEQKFEEALNSIKKTLKLDPKHLSSYLYLVTIYKKLEKDKEILKVCQKMTKMFPHSNVAWSLLTDAYLETKDYKNALSSIKKLYKINPNDQKILITYATVLDKVGKKKKALKYYEKFFKDSSKFQTIREKTSQFIKAFANILEAEEKLVILDKNPIFKENLSFQIHRIIIYWKQNKFDDIWKILNKLKIIYPSLPIIYYLEASIFESNKQIVKAFETYRLIPTESEFYLSSQLKISELHILRKEYHRALQVINDLINSKHTTWDLYIVASNIYDQLKQYDKASEIVNTGYVRHPSKVKLLFLRGVYEEKAQLVDTCISTMLEVIEKDPEYSNAYNYLGYLYAEMGTNLEDAEQLILTALDLKPDDGYFLDSLGWVYYKQGKYEEALEVLLKSEEKLPEESIVLEHLADTYIKVFQNDKAIEYYKKALKGDAEDNELQRIRKKLKKLQP